MLEIEKENGEVFHMIESGAIITFLADIYPEKKLSPHPIKDTIKRMDYLQMLHFCSTMMDMALWQIRMNTNILPESERSEIIIERYKKKNNLRNRTPDFKSFAKRTVFMRRRFLCC